MTRNDDCPCRAACGLDSPPRRKAIKIATAGLAAGLGLTGELGLAKPIAGDRLVSDDYEGKPLPLSPSDVKPGKPLLAFPYDASKNLVRDDSRLNKLVLMRFPESEMDAATKARAAGGVIALSAICTHQACEVKTWLSKEKALVCFCHSSKFLPLSAGEVASGPAARPLPLLPLRLEGEQLVVAGPFSAPPGGAN